MLQKFEADVRQHIRIEQQLKLHIETIQEKLEEDEKLLEKYKLEKVAFNYLLPYLHHALFSLAEYQQRKIQTRNGTNGRDSHYP